MKRRIVLLVSVLFTVFTLSACTNIDIEPNVIGVVFENIRYEGDSILVDVYITNGKDADQDIDEMEFWLEIPGTEDEVCGAIFDLYTTIESNDYELWELEFTSEFIFMSNSEIEAAGYDIADLDLLFYLEE